jgi:hypothetical protein
MTSAYRVAMVCNLVVTPEPVLIALVAAGAVAREDGRQCVARPASRSVAPADARARRDMNWRDMMHELEGHDALKTHTYWPTNRS